MAKEITTTGSKKLKTLMLEFNEYYPYLRLGIFHLSEKQKVLNYLEVDSLKDWKTRNIKDEHFDFVSFDELEKNDWVLIPNVLKSAYNSISKQSENLENLIGSDCFDPYKTRVFF